MTLSRDFPNSILILEVKNFKWEGLLSGDVICTEFGLAVVL